MSEAVNTPSKNEIRSARTRERVLTAAISCIYEVGLQNTSTVDVTKRAGISRGAMLHHYPSKEDLLCAAYESLLTQEAGKLRDAAGGYTNRDLTLEEFIDHLWSRFSVRSFSITLDYIAAARTNAGLMKRVRQARKQYDEALEEIWEQFFAGGNLSERETKTQLKLTISLFRGMSLQLMMHRDRSELDEMVNEWKTHLKAILAR